MGRLPDTKLSGHPTLSDAERCYLGSLLDWSIAMAPTTREVTLVMRRRERDDLEWLARIYGGTVSRAGMYWQWRMLRQVDVERALRGSLEFTHRRRLHVEAVLDYVQRMGDYSPTKRTRMCNYVRAELGLDPLDTTRATR
jgi:hypothetical protein